VRRREALSEEDEVDGEQGTVSVEADVEDDEAAEIRYSLTALGEAVLAERRGRRFRGFGPCTTVASGGAALTLAR
jgi:hypothetical protein